MMGTKRQKMDYAGLRRRETYEEIINYLENEQEIIKYPDRRAKFLRDSPYLTQLDGEGIRTLEEQETGAIRQRAKDDMLRELGYKADGTVSRAERAATFDIGTAPSTPTYGAASPDDDFDLFRDYTEPGAESESRIRSAMRDLATGASGAASSTANTLAAGVGSLASDVGSLASDAGSFASGALSAASDTLRRDMRAAARITEHAKQAARQAALSRGQQFIEGSRALVSKAKGAAGDYALEVRDFYTYPFKALQELTTSRPARQNSITGTSQPWAAATIADAFAEDSLRERGHHTKAYIDHMTAASSSRRPIDTFEPRVQYPYPMSTPLARPAVPNSDIEIHWLPPRGGDVPGRSPGNFANSMAQLQDRTTATPGPGSRARKKESASSSSSSKTPRGTLAKA